MRTTRRSILAVAVSLGAIATACDDGPSSTASPASNANRQFGEVDVPREDRNSDSGADSTGGGAQGIRTLRLAPFADCAALLDHVKQHARERVGPYGLDPYGYPSMRFAERGTVGMAAEASATTVAAARADDGDSASGQPVAAQGGITGTNTQEQGVDEPDLIKTDGRRIVTLVDNVLSHVDISGGTPVLTGTLTLPPEGWGHQLFLSGDRALVVTNSEIWSAPIPVDADQGVARDEMSWPSGRPSATVLEVDLSDPSAPRITATLRIEGQYLNARAIADRMLLAVSSGPQWMPWLYPQSPSGEERAREANQQLIDETTLADWVPQFELDADGATSSGDLLTCEQLHRPPEFSGFDVISVIGLDMAAGLGAGFTKAQATGVLAGGQTVYASHDRFYVATTRWAGADIADDEQTATWTEDYTTEIHAFSIDPGSALDYVASGSVAGTLLNSFSLDEHDGYLRVLALDGTPWDQGNPSETRLTVLAEQGDRLVPVGQVGGLGRGEALYSARLIGDRGFAVTFRQIDPFYVLDLSDPTAPRVTGELEIPGFSTYLHPVSDHRVLGVGRDVTETGVMQGLKLSLFDVADPAKPIELSTWTLSDAYSIAEQDHHAFQMVGSTAVLPVESYADGFAGAIVFDIGDTITELGRISHVAADQQPASDCRQLVEGDVPADSALYWYSVDTFTRTQLCEPNDAGGFGNWYCDQVALDQLVDWVGVETAAADAAAVEPGADRLEFCYPPGNYMHAIMRSIAVDGTLWTMSPTTLVAHALPTLETLATVGLRA